MTDFDQAPDVVGPWGPPPEPASPQRKPQDPALRQCTRDGCTGPVKHPRDRTPGRVADDYCSPGCIPAWLVGMEREVDTLGNYATRPFDTWLRSGEPMLMPTSDVPPRFDGDGLGEESMADCLAELEAEPLEAEPPREPPRHHVWCARCGEAVHQLHAVYPKRVRDAPGPYCSGCVVQLTRKITNGVPLTAPEEP